MYSSSDKYIDGWLPLAVTGTHLASTVRTLCKDPFGDKTNHGLITNDWWHGSIGIRDQGFDSSIFIFIFLINYAISEKQSRIRVNNESKQDFFVRPEEILMTEIAPCTP